MLTTECETVYEILQKNDSLMTRVIFASVCVKRSKRHVPSKNVCGELFPVCVSSSSTFKTSTSLQTQSTV